jgi:hypothetical protein
VTTDSLKRAVRTFIITTLALFLPGLLGWLHDLTSWASGQGTTPFPDAHGLAYLFVSAITAGVVALVNLAINWLEDATGVHVLRDTSADPYPAEDVDVDEEPHEIPDDPDPEPEPAEPEEDDADVDPEDRVDLAEDDHAGD